MVKTWVADVSALLNENVYQKYYEMLPLWRREKANQCKQMKNKALSVGAWALWEYAKKQEQNPLPEEPIYNLSHSGHYVMCSYSDLPGAKVGCDLEMLGKERLPVAERFFCESEYQHILNMENTEERTRMFYRSWVLKESFMKATRAGMALDTKSFEIGWNLEGEPVMLRKPSEYPETYYYKEYTDVKIKACMAVCTTDAQVENALHVLTF